MPAVGLGVYEAADTKAACLSALAQGYRHIDTAQFYHNEAEVGAAVRECGVPREELFVTTKVWIDRFDRAEASVRESLAAMGLAYVDLCLLHAPVEGKRVAAYKALEKLHDEGLCRAIGVSNYGVAHLEEVLRECSVPPAVNQIELPPFFLRRDIVACCEANGVLVQAFSPLAKASRMDDPTIAAVAAEVGKTYAQVMLRWGLLHAPCVLPKSNHAARQAENAALDFDFSPEQRARLDALASPGGGCTWDPTKWN